METNSFVSTYRKRVGVVQNSVEQKLEPENDVNISKVLCVNARACIDQVEVLNGEAVYTGEVVFDAVVTDEQGNLVTITEKTNFQGKIENDILNATMLPIYKVEVVNVTIQNASSSGLKVTALVELTLDVLVNDQVTPFMSYDDNIKTKTEMVNVLALKENGSATFTVNEDIEVKNGDIKVLTKNVSFACKDVKSGTGYFTVEGDMCVNICYEMGEEDNKTVKCLCENFYVKEEVELENLTKDDLVDVMLNVKCRDVELTIAGEEEGKTTLALSVPIAVKYVVFNKNEQQITTDAYCTSHNMNLISESFNYTKAIQTVRETKTIDSEITLQDDEPRISKILFVCGENATITNNYFEDDKLFIEGIITANVVYMADNDNDEICSVVVENPFKVEFNQDVLNTDNLLVKVSVKDCNGRAKKGKDLELEFSLCMVADAFLTGQESYLKEVQLTEELKARPYSLQIYFAPANSDIWQISKQLRVSPEVILAQNPNLVFPLDKPEQIVYFIQK